MEGDKSRQITRDGDCDIRPADIAPQIVKVSGRPDAGAEVAVHEADAENPGMEDLGMLKYVAFAVAAMFALWCMSMLYPLVRGVLEAEGPAKAVAWAFLLVPVSLLGALAVVTWLRFRAIPKGPHFVAADFAGREKELKRRLQREYVARFPSPGAYACDAGFAQDDPVVVKLGRLKAAAGAYPTHEEWLDDFREFQRGLDARADKAIRAFAKLVAVKTAVIPWRGVDALAVFFNSTMMVCRLAKIYRVRTTKAAAFRMVMHWAMNIYISGNMGDIAESASDSVGEGVRGAMDPDAMGGVIAAAIPIGTKIMGKAAEGAANAYLLYRLGQRAKRAFRALQERQ